MSIINILINMGILLACSIIQVFGVFIEGVGKLFHKLAEYLETLHDKLRRLTSDPKTEKKQTNIDIPL